jgi:hypothetical protein
VVAVEKSIQKIAGAPEMTQIEASAQTHEIAREYETAQGVGYKQVAVGTVVVGKISGDEVEVETVPAVGIYSVAVDNIGDTVDLQEMTPAAVGPWGPVGHAGVFAEGNSRCGPYLSKMPSDYLGLLEVNIQYITDNLPL